jgi:hypothetical protein
MKPVPVSVQEEFSSVLEAVQLEVVLRREVNVVTDLVQ